MSLRKIPLETLIQILQDLYDGGADYVDISGDTDVDGNPRDTLKVTVKPEYISTMDEDIDIAVQEKLDISLKDEDTPPSIFSDEDINDLI